MLFTHKLFNKDTYVAWRQPAAEKRQLQWIDQDLKEETIRPEKTKTKHSIKTRLYRYGIGKAQPHSSSQALQIGPRRFTFLTKLPSPESRRKKKIITFRNCENPSQGKKLQYLCGFFYIKPE